MADVFSSVQTSTTTAPTVTVRVPAAQPDDTSAPVNVMPRERQAIPGPIKQLEATLQGIIRDPFGAVIGMVVQPFKDLKTAFFSITPEELANPIIRARIISLGGDPDKMVPTATANEVSLAGGRSLALLAGGGAAAGVSRLLGPALTAPAAAGHGALEAIAFGTVGGAITPVEEGQTRGGNILTWNALGVPFGAAGGLVSHAIQARVRRAGAKPELETPEATPTPKDFDPGTAARQPGVALERPRPVEIPPGAEIVEPTRLLGKSGTKSPVQQVLDALAIDEKAITPKFTLRERVDGFYTALVDDLHPINVATKELLRLRQATPGTGTAVALPMPGLKPGSLIPGVRLPALQDPYVLARLTRGATAKATQFLETGPLHWETLQPVGPGLREILRPIAERGAENELRAFLVSPRALALADRGIETPINPQAAKAVIEGASHDVTQAALNTFKYTDQVLQYDIDSGLIPAAHAETWRALNQHYVPFWRYVEESRTPTYPGMGGSSKASVGHGVKPSKGGSAKVMDPLENVVKNTYAMVSRADRYAVGDALVRLAETVPEQQIVRPVTPPPPHAAKGVALQLRQNLEALGYEVSEEMVGRVTDIAQSMNPSLGAKEGTFWVWRNGQKKFYEVDAPLYRALMDMDRESSNALVKLLSVPATIQKTGFTTLSPTFPIRNPLRDQFSAAVFSRYGFKPGYDLMRGTFHVLGRDELYQSFRRSGGEYAVLARSTGTDRIAAQKLVGDLLKTNSPLAQTIEAMRTPRGVLEALRKISEVSEEASRSQEFARGLAATGDPRLAGFGSRDVTLDFQRMGWAVRVANQLIPFLNPAIQDLDKIARTFGAEGGARAASAGAQAVAYITLPTIALYLLNRGDPNYQELSEARKDFFWNIPLWHTNGETGMPERSGKFLTIPKPFLQGMIFGSAPERALRWIDERDPAALDGFAANFLGSAAPPLLPAAIAPAIEAVTNYDLFRERPIVPEAEQRLIKEEQAGPLQGETVRLIGKALDVSPRQVEHLLEGYSGGFSGTVITVTDAALRLTGIKSPEPGEDLATKIPVWSKIVESFIVNEPTINSKSVQKFYENAEEVKAVMATVRSLARDGRGEDAGVLAKGMVEEVAAYKSFVQTEAAIAQLRDAISVVRGAKQLPMAEREQKILLLGRTIRTLAQGANRTYATIKTKIGQASTPAASRLAPLGTTVVPLPEP